MANYDRLRSQDIERAVELGGRLVGCHDLTAFKKDVLEDFTHFLGAETSAFLTFSERDKLRVGFNCAHGVPEKMHQDYVGGFFKKDPAFDVVFGNEPFSGSRRNSDVILLEQHVDYYDFTGGFFYNTFLRPLHIHHLMFMKIMMRPEDNCAICIGLHRPKKKGGFSTRHFQKAQLMVPTVAGGMYNLISQNLLRERQAIIDHLARGMEKTGLLILDGNLDSLYMSSVFQTHAGLGTPVPARLPAALLRTCQDLKSRMEEGGKQGAGMHGECHSADHALSFSISLCQTENSADDLRFVIYSYERSGISLSEDLMRRHHLTHREKDVACQIILGLTNTQIADKLGISKRTVENHLRAIYSKTKVRNRTSLTYTLSRPHS